jgi:hypothetical protein
MRGRYRRHRGTLARLLFEKTLETLESAFTRADTLAAKPILERFFPDIHAGEQISAPKLREERERMRRAILENRVQSRNVGCDHGRIESDLVAVRDERVDSGMDERLAQGG